MRKYLLFLLAFTVCLSAEAQKGKTAHSTKSPQKTEAKKNTTKKDTKTTTDKKQKGTQQSPSGKKGIALLQEERRQVMEAQKASAKKKEELQRDVKKGMDHLMMLDTEIARQNSVIDTIRNDISVLDEYIAAQDSELVVLQGQLEDRKQRYMKSMRYMHRNRSVQSQLAFVFSADNFNQMFRRLRFSREYASFQRAQGEAVKAKQEEVTQKRFELNISKQQKDALLDKGEQAKRQLEDKQTEQKAQVEKLKKEQKTVQALIEQQQKKEQELNQRIDKLIAEEIAREKARQEAEARKRAQEEAARQKAAELAKRKAAAEAARKESERRQANQKKPEETSSQRQQASASKRKSTTTPPIQPSKPAKLTPPPEDKRLSGNFAANRGYLPLPITGSYQLLRGFGTFSPEGLSRVKLQSNGWYLRGAPGAKAKSVFSGVVSGVYNLGGRYMVTVRHGNYISAYINLASPHVKMGQKVRTGDILGSLGNDNTLQFQLRNWNTLLNPAKWIRR